MITKNSQLPEHVPSQNGCPDVQTTFERNIVMQFTHVHFLIKSALVIVILTMSMSSAYGQLIFQDGPDEASERHALLDMFDIEIEDIHRSIDLSDIQIRQLKLAAKAVANKAIANREIAMLPRGGVGRETLNLKGYFSDEDEENEGDVTDENDGLVQRVAMPINKTEVLESRLWKEAVLSVLNEQQKQVRLKQEEEFENRLRNAAIEYQLMQYAYKLRLAVEQYDQMREVVERVQGDELVDRLKRGNEIDEIFLQQDDLTNISEDDVVDFLTESQLNRLKSMQNPGSGLRLNVVPQRKKDSQELGVTLEGTRSLEVKKVRDGTIAQELGVLVGDTIDKINDKPIDSRRQLRQAVERTKKITSITVIRDGETVSLESK